MRCKANHKLFHYSINIRYNRPSSLWASKEIVLLRNILILITFIFSLTAMNVEAAPNISPSQLEMFKKLPKAQQEALAKRYGIDLNMLNNQQADNASQSTTNEYQPYQLEEEETVSPFPEDEFFQPEDNQLARFGENFFETDSFNYANPSAQSAPLDYVVSVGDTLQVTLYGNETEQFEVTVNSDGLIIVPGLSPLSVVGLSLQEVKQLVSDVVGKEVIGQNALVSISNLQPIKVFVTGEVIKPGPYVLPPLSTATTAISFAGGISEVGGYRNIQVKRSGNAIATFDLYDLLVEGSSVGDATLKTGDVVLVPTANKVVSIDGAVRRPGIYELAPNETLTHLVKLAGGVNTEAYVERVSLETFSASQSKQVLGINLKDKQAISLSDGDKVFIPKKPSEAKDTVYLLGAVNRPGEYQWYKGLKLSEVVANLDIDLLPITDLSYALIISENDKAQITVKQFIPTEIYNKDVELAKGDQVVFFSRYELRSQEQEQLRRYAYTEQELIEEINRLDWASFQQKRFEQYIADEGTFEDDLAKAQQAKKRAKESFQFSVSNEFPIYLTSLVAETEELSKEEVEAKINKNVSTFSRSRMLSPILKLLAKQHHFGNVAQIVEVSGNVKYPGLYPISADTQVKDIIYAAGGILEGTYMTHAEVTRLVEAQGVDVENISFSLAGALQGTKEDNINLRGRDYINVFKSPNWKENQVVELIGEVLLPGRYTIKRGETLKSVIERAGGFTEQADPSAAVFTRESLKEQEEKYLKDLSESLKQEILTNNLNSSDSILSNGADGIGELIDQLSETEAVGRLIIDLDEVIAGSSNLVLENKDKLYIPTQRQSVNVIGEVYVATSHLFKNDLDISDYINLSGGYKDKAAMEKVYVIKANGKVIVPEASSSWFAVNTQRSNIEPGDTIVVPLDSTYKDNLTLWTQVTQIIYQLGVAVAAVGSL